MSGHVLKTNDWPDATNGVPCCMGNAVYGPGGCTCWEPVYDQEQSDQRDVSPPKARQSMCHDCAYRKGSPERSGDEGYTGDESLLKELAYSGQPFFCHQGSRRVLRYRHPSGMELDAHPAAYDPPICQTTSGPAPLKADGTPQDHCAGWALMRDKFQKEAKP